MAGRISPHGPGTLEAAVLARREQIEGDVGTVAAAQPDPGAIGIHYDGFPATAEPVIISRVRRWLSADWDPAEAIAVLGEDGVLIRRGGGRILRCSSFYEDFVKTVLTINTAWSSTRRMAAALVAEPGNGAFPLPDAILDYGEGLLRERAKLGFRAPTVVSATRRMLEDGVDRPKRRGPARIPLRLSDRAQGHRSLCRGALPAPAARF